VIVGELFERFAEPLLAEARPPGLPLRHRGTLSADTRKPGNPRIAERFELYVAHGTGQRLH